MKVFYLFALIILAIASWLSASLLWGSQGPERLIVWAIVAWLFVSALAWAARKMSAKVWIYAGLLNLAGLFLPAMHIRKDPPGPLVAAVRIPNGDHTSFDTFHGAGHCGVAP
jgi:hypothetical protein